MVKLTAKQEIFVNSLVAGLSQRQAYRKAYNAEKMTDDTVDARASKLLKEYKVSIRYRELLKEASNMAIWSREQAFSEYEWLKNKAKQHIDKEGVKQANSNAFLGALDGMNKMAFTDLEKADKKIAKEIEYLEQRIRNISGEDDTEFEDDDFLNALEESAVDVWQDQD